MKKYILSILACIACSSQGATLVVQSGSPAVDIKLSSTAVLPTAGGGVVLGFFRGYTNTTTANTALATALSDPTPGVRTFIANNFVPIGIEGADTDYGTSAAANPLTLRDSGGSTTIAGTIENSNWVTGTANSENASGLVRGTRIFMMVYSGSSLATASELGVFSGTTWNLSTSAAVNTLSMTLTQIDTDAEVFRGARGSLILAPIVPEPTTSAFGLLALGLLLRRKR